MDHQVQIQHEHYIKRLHGAVVAVNVYYVRNSLQAEHGDTDRLPPSIEQAVSPSYFSDVAAYLRKSLEQQQRRERHDYASPAPALSRQAALWRSRNFVSYQETPRGDRQQDDCSSVINPTPEQYAQKPKSCDAPTRLGTENPRHKTT